MAGVADYINRYRPGAEAKEIGIGGFTAIARVSETYKLASDAPDTAVEDGSFIHDHIILKPVTLSITGSVSDVHVRRNPIVRDFIRAQAEVGNITSQYTSNRTQSQIAKLSAIANEAADAIRKLDALVAAGEQVNKLFGNKDAAGKTIREHFIDDMEALYYGKQAFTVDMPYRQFNNMIITSIAFSTDNAADDTGFSIDVKQLTFAKLETIEVAPNPAAGTGGQLEEKKDQGTQSGEPVEKSLVKNILDLF